MDDLEQLKKENEELKNKIDEVKQKTNNFILNLIDNFPEVGIWILTTGNDIVKENKKEGN